MNGRDKQELGEILEESAAMYGRTLNELGLAAYYRVLRTLNIDAVRKAMVKLLGDENRKDFMPTAAEIKAVARSYSADDGERLTRCLHENTARTWRCPALFAFRGELNPHERDYCPQHRDFYKPGAPATPEEISEVFAEALAANPTSSFLRSVVANRAQRLAQGDNPLQAAIAALTGAIGGTIPDASDSVEVVQARKADQLARAKEKGLLI